jgi:hypothetical protein
MALNKNICFGMRSEKCGVHIPTTPQEQFVKRIYASVDEATTLGLQRLRSETGTLPTCKLGCSHCCRHHILMNSAEAHTLAQYIRREWSAGQIDDLRMRTQQWHEWDNARPGRYPTDVAARTDLSKYEPCCPLLVNDACSAYTVRPVVCRTHYVSSPVSACRASNDPHATQEAPVALTAIVTAAGPHVLSMRHHIESSGADFSRSVMLLPHGLAVEMEWDFAILD